MKIVYQHFLAVEATAVTATAAVASQSRLISAISRMGIPTNELLSYVAQHISAAVANQGDQQYHVDHKQIVPILVLLSAGF